MIEIRQFSGKELVEDKPHRKNIDLLEDSARSARHELEIIRGKINEIPYELIRIFRRIIFPEAGIDVNDLCRDCFLLRAVEQHIIQLDVPVDQPRLVQRTQSMAEDLHKDDLLIDTEAKDFLFEIHRFHLLGRYIVMRTVAEELMDPQEVPV